jgi:hypothetical protein
MAGTSKGFTMTDAAARKQTITDLKAEIAAISEANQQFWALDPDEELYDAKIEYDRRRRRLEEIRLELLKL